MKTISALLTAVCACAQSGLVQPQLGQFLDRRGVLWPVYGIPGSFVVRNPSASAVLGTACSRQLCLTKTEFGVVANGRFSRAPRGTALIAVDGFGTGAWLYFPRQRELLRWQQGTLTPVDVRVEGEVLAIGPGPTLAVRRGNGIWIVSLQGAILDALPPDAGAVLLAQGATVYATPDALVLRRSEGREVRFPAAGVESMFQLGDDLVEARAGAAIYALATDEGQEALFQLPQPLETRR